MSNATSGNSTKGTMASPVHFVLLTLFISSLQHTPTLATKKSYIVFLDTHSHSMNPTEATENNDDIAVQSHYDLLESVLGSHEKAKESLKFSCNKYINNGFVAKLSKDEAKMIKTSSHVISLMENRHLELHTTRSWEFLGLEHHGITPSHSLWNISGYGDGVIIGNLDTGVWPESQSFDDQGLGPIPKKWKGECVTGSDTTFKCNKKLIGARYFSQDQTNESSLSPRDVEGHGSHTLSIAGGSFVKGANLLGFGSGIAKGGSPKARVVSYKVVWPKHNDEGGCVESDVIAAFDAAIRDGVDVLSLSIGGESVDYMSDGIAIGSFRAVQNGISVVASAGNNGPRVQSVSNIAPWMLTVAASTSDRAFANRVLLGNSTLRFTGGNLGFHKMRPKGQFYPLIDGEYAVANYSSAELARFCEDKSLDQSKVKGKIVVCKRGKNERLATSRAVKAAGGIGMILVNDVLHGDQVETDPHVIPASHISYEDGLALMQYLNKSANPTAYITEVKTEFGIKRSPMMASFSSRGPSSLYPQILKPDITAPGVDVIAAFSPAVGLNDSDGNRRQVSFNKMSGTSMASPHVAGLVGLLKSLYPDWTPAAIRSALMTTATPFDNDNKPIQDYNEQNATPFEYGAGHVNPNAAVDPGLVYNLTETDYLDFLCSIGTYTEDDLKVFTMTPHKCTNSKTMLDLNYPSITVTNLTTSATLTRIVTNVGNPGTYTVNVTDPLGVSVIVSPSRLKFHRIGERREFRVKVKAFGKRPKLSHYVFGSLVWTDGIHNVRSPLVVEMAGEERG